MSRPIRALIVDDEALARKRVRDLLTRQPDCRIVGEASNGKRALVAIRDKDPDLLFLDVQMPELDGFEVLKAIGPAAMPVTIMVTAYDRYALEAFERHAIDYLLKPFDDHRFETALERARTFLGGTSEQAWSRRMAQLVASLPQPDGPPVPSRLTVKDAGRIYLVDVRDIDWIEAGGVYAQLHVGSKCHLLRRSLTSLEAELDPTCFVRIHRSSLVPIARIAEIRPRAHGEYDVILTTGVRLKVSRTYADRFKRAVGLD